MSESKIVRIKLASYKRRFFACIIDWVILIPLYIILYPLWKEKIKPGQSIGKWIAGIRVIDFKSGLPPSLKQSIVRNIFQVVTFGFGIIFVFLNDGNRHIGDLFSGTMVIINPE